MFKFSNLWSADASSVCVGSTLQAPTSVFQSPMPCSIPQSYMQCQVSPVWLVTQFEDVNVLGRPTHLWNPGAAFSCLIEYLRSNRWFQRSPVVSNLHLAHTPNVMPPLTSLTYSIISVLLTWLLTLSSKRISRADASKHFNQLRTHNANLHVLLMLVFSWCG